MDPSYEAMWVAPNHAYVPSHQHQAAVFDFTPELSQVPSLTGSPASCSYDQFPPQIQQEYYPRVADETMQYNAYHQMPMTPSEFGSDHDTPYCSPPPLSQQMDQIYAQVPQPSAPAERQHTTSGRRRAQNRAAQRAFRERKDKHARDLEVQLAALTDKHHRLQSSYSELNAAYEKLRKTIELITQDDDAEGEEEEGNTARRRSSTADTVTRKLVEILHVTFWNPTKPCTPGPSVLSY
ncbi:hypothetical protein P280DRAFT_552693 [Massarina eburnea CBS 473.64]|uniref:BZIP domain-containing protein n=1 Tax=Massarina eburnea CBS 473.64 TaxID=1395130 RepID=A0A6A6RMY8_9PLEO|nr:hypothetical protein P280DRAFT_552693 [Massarina eburnea CBS 473.64]